MTEAGASEPAVTGDPAQIVVNGDPRRDQIEALIRQVLLILATAATALGSVGWAGKLNALAIVAGPVAGLVVMVWGQFKTRSIASKAAQMANLLDNRLATTK